MDPVQLAKLVDQHAAALALYARAWCAQPEDVVQDAFLQLARQRRPPDRAVAWLYRVVRNAAVSAHRKETRRRRHEAVAAARTTTWFCPTEGTGLDGQRATQALQELPTDLREPVVAHLWGGLSFVEVGELMGVSASTAHRRYLEGLAALRERLRVPCPTPPTT